MRIPCGHIHPGRANRVGINVFPLVALRVGEEPEGGDRDELRDVHIGGVADERVVAHEGLDERAAFRFRAVVDGIEEDVELNAGGQFSISD